MVTIAIETVGEERFIRGFNRYVADMEDFSEVFEVLGKDFWKLEEKIFDAEGTPDAFAPLSPRYKKWKDEHFPGRRIMELRGRLRGALTGTHQAASQDTIKKIGKKAAEYGAKVPYIHRHQMGTGGMPARKVVQLTEQDKTRWARIIQRWSFEKLQARVGGPYGMRGSQGLR